MTIATQFASLFIVAVLTLFAAGDAFAQAPAQHVRITIADATRIALERVPGGTVIEVEQDSELGRRVFDVEVQDREGWKHEVVIDAEDGRVLREGLDD